MDTKPYDFALNAASFLTSRADAPDCAVVLGSGLGAFAEQLVEPDVISYGEIPGFPKVGVAGHAGQLVVGRVGQDGPRVAALSGRVHLYEGHDPNLIVHPVRTLSLWGVNTIVFTNAAGAIHTHLKPGDLMLISDHINLTGLNPLTGHNDERLGTRFPDMSYAYDRHVTSCFQDIAKEQNIHVGVGVYAGLKGPSYETPAEIRMLGTIGADAVGMSTVCEVIAARHMGMTVAGISCITNYAAGLSDDLLDHSEVKATADMARNKFLKLLNGGIKRILTKE
ncbi:MAG: purine-nucleoside phosphorylase [Myxococcota bacterium]|nr:purine-nucleoside phosphorylase [Myxococcota bacterium]